MKIHAKTRKFRHVPYNAKCKVSLLFRVWNWKMKSLYPSFVILDNIECWKIYLTATVSIKYLKQIKNSKHRHWTVQCMQQFDRCSLGIWNKEKIPLKVFLLCCAWQGIAYSALNHEKCTVSIMQCCRKAFHKANVIKPTHAELTRFYCTYNGATITLL